MEIRISCSKLSHFSIPNLRSFLPQRMEKLRSNLFANIVPMWAVLDLKLPGINGLEIVERAATCISSPQVVMCCTESDPDFIDAAFQAGILGYILKNGSHLIWFAQPRRLHAENASCQLDRLLNVNNETHSSVSHASNASVFPTPEEHQGMVAK